MHEFKEQERKYAGFQMCVRAVWEAGAAGEGKIQIHEEVGKAV